MDTSNHSLRPVHSRLYNLTPAGSRLAHYLLYVDRQPQVVASDIAFGEIGNPPEQAEPLPELERLNRELDRALQVLRDHAHSDDESYQAAYLHVKRLRARIYELENEGE